MPFFDCRKYQMEGEIYSDTNTGFQIVQVELTKPCEANPGNLTNIYTAFLPTNGFYVLNVRSMKFYLF